MKLFTTHEGYQLSEQFLTPTEATKILSASDSDQNRAPRQTVIDKYRSDMEQDLWGFCEVPIVISAEKDVIQGSHRLRALAGADIDGIWFLVIEGVPHSVIHNMDAGLKRTASDQLRLQGVPNYTNAAAVVSSWLAWNEDAGTSSQQGKHLSVANVLKVYHQNAESVQKAIRDISRAKKLITTRTAAPLWREFEKLDPEANTLFWNLLGASEASGQRGPADQPIVVLRDYLLRTAASRSLPPVRYLRAALVKGWNAWRDGKVLLNGSSLRLRVSGNSPEPFPKAH